MRSESKANKEQLPENIPTDNDASVYELLKGRLKFTNESQWTRIVLYLITALFFIGIFWLLKGAAILGFLSRKLGDKWNTVSRFFKGSLP
jgi:hypothetical protein